MKKPTSTKSETTTRRDLGNPIPVELEKLALESPNAVKALGGAGVRKVIVRAPKLVNIVPDA